MCSYNAFKRIDGYIVFAQYTIITRLYDKRKEHFTTIIKNYTKRPMFSVSVMESWSLYTAMFNVQVVKYILQKYTK